jgi:hypothetical protein
MTDEQFDNVRAGRVPLTPEAIDEVLGEVRAVMRAAEPDIGAVLFLTRLRGLVRALEDEVFNATQTGSRPLAPEIADSLFSDARAAIVEAPGPTIAIVKVRDFSTEVLRDLVSRRGLEQVVQRRVQRESVPEREAMRAAILGA